MANHLVQFDTAPDSVHVATGTLLVEAAAEAGINILQPCGGQGRCGRCAVRVESGAVRRRSILRLSPEDIEAGYALACQTVVEGDVEIAVPPQEQIERRMTTDHVAAEVAVPAGYDPSIEQTIRRVTLTLTPPSMDDQTDDWSRLCTALRREVGIEHLDASLDQLRTLGPTLRDVNWQLAVTVDLLDEAGKHARLIRIQPVSDAQETSLYGVAIDIGTTTVTVVA